MTRSPKPISKLLSVVEAASALAVSVKTMRRLIERDEIRTHRIGRCIRISEEELSLYLARSRR